MLAALLLLVQAAAATPPERIDLTLPAGTAGCTAASGDEVVVCGRAERYRLGKLTPPPDATLVPKAETGLFGGAARAAIETEAVTMPGGLRSDRLMARIKLPF